MKELLVKTIIGVTINMVDIPSRCPGITDEQVAVMRSKLAEMMGDED
jgi:hypothetical protein